MKKDSLYGPPKELFDESEKPTKKRKNSKKAGHDDEINEGEAFD